MTAPTPALAAVATPAAGTVADLVDHWTAQRHAGTYSPATVSAYLGAIARVLGAQNIPGTVLLDDLDLPALLAAHEAAHPHLKPSTLGSVAAALRAALSGYRARHKPSLTEPFTPPDPEPAEQDAEETDPNPPDQVEQPQFDGSLGQIPEFAERAGRSGLINQTTARLLAEGVRRILTDVPESAATPAANAEPDVIMTRFLERNPGLKATTIATYGSRLLRGITAYCAYLAHPDQPTPAKRRAGPRPAPRATEITLPGGRTVSFAAPADFTPAEAAATAGLLRLYHPAMFTSAPGTPAPSTGHAWTLVFWPESAPDEPESAHLSGPSFRRALADYIRTRCPETAGHDDGAAIDAWFADEVFVALALDGHHEARDAGSLL